MRCVGSPLQVRYHLHRMSLCLEPASAHPDPRRGWFLAIVAFGFCACGRGTRVLPPAFEATSVFPLLAVDSQPLMLNDAITVYFSEPVDALTVTRDSFAVVDAEGHPVRGKLHVDGSWVTFEPEAPLSPDLLDGSMQPSAVYRLAVQGYPRADGIRSISGHLLQEGVRRTFRTAGLGSSLRGLPAPLRPVHADSRPFMLRPSELGSVPMPADDPRLQLHFTLPVLPASATPAAFEITLLRRGAPVGHVERIEPRAVRLLSQQAVDEFWGATVELEFGNQVRVAGSNRAVPLQPDDFLCVKLLVGTQGLLDYAGRSVPMQMQWCYVVPGDAVAVAEWPAAEEERPWLDADLAAPGFEITGHRSVRPLVRVEAGDGSLGTFRPQRDTTLAVGVPFDRGDGELRVVDRPVFDFAAIDVPSGITVRVVAPGQRVQLRARGRVRLDGTLEIASAGAVLALVPGQLVDFSAICNSAALTLVAASGVEVRGHVEAPTGTALPFAIVTAGLLDVSGSVPVRTLLATERGTLLLPGELDGCVGVRVRLEPGLPADVRCVASGYTPFAAMPADRAAAQLRVQGGSSSLRVQWQLLPADPLLRTQPDLDPSRAAPPRDVVGSQRIFAPPGSFLRLRLQTEVRGGVPLSELLSVRALDR